MVKRQLLYKEWKQSELTFILVMLVAVFATPLSLLMEYSSYQTCLKDEMCTPAGEFYYSFHSDSFLSVSWIIGLFFALMILGIERNKGLMDFTLSLPFSRSSIYHSKFMLGAGMLIFIHGVSYGITGLFILWLHPSETSDFNSEYYLALIGSLMVYSLFLAAGTLTGNLVAQVLVGFSTSILPFLVIGLPLVHLDFLLQTTESLIDNQLNRLIMPMSPVMYITNEPQPAVPYLFPGDDIVIPTMMFILFYIIGLIGFLKNPMERNGRFFLFSKMDRPIQIMVIVFGILGFGWLGFSSDNSMFGYIAGMLIGGAVGALTSYFLIYRKR
ncbi:ABC transporter ATP-binding protein [Bacillus australimaris]|uniref:ABC transporter ATP-binding protein n=1 Tax=Bacillus australimaris TaxID=1326968 RepID=A0ABD4QGA1_9BACI|nr:ABC transporter permease [Bacillus australimaris]KPN16026.1 ABC transporter ATP-binding protein [Bacillus australimaris]MBR8689013.1 ABC transporter permease [Bacillus australimaris]